MPIATENEKLSDFGRRLRGLIARAGFKSRNAFVKALGTDGNTVYRWEIGAVTPHGDALEQLSDMLGVSIDEIMGRTPSEPSVEQARATVDAWLAKMGDRVSDAHRERLRTHRWSLPVPIDEDIVSGVWARMMRDDARPPPALNPPAAAVEKKGLRVVPRTPTKRR